MYTLDNDLLKEDGSGMFSSSCYPSIFTNPITISIKNLDVNECIHILDQLRNLFDFKTIVIRKRGDSIR